MVSTTSSNIAFPFYTECSACSKHDMMASDPSVQFLQDGNWLSGAALGVVERISLAQELHSPTVPALSEKWPWSKSQTHLRFSRVTGWWIYGVKKSNTWLVACTRPSTSDKLIYRQKVISIKKGCAWRREHGKRQQRGMARNMDQKQACMQTNKWALFYLNAQIHIHQLGAIFHV